MPKLKTPLIISMLAIGIVCGYVAAKTYSSGPKSNMPVIFRINEIKKVRQLKLVTYHFEEIIPIEKNGKIKLLLIVPATVSGYLDLDDLNYVISNDTIISVKLPEPVIDSATFQIENAVNYDLEKKFSISLGTGLYQEVFSELKEKLRTSKLTVTEKALTMGIRTSTEDAAKEYLNALLSDLNYTVDFSNKSTLQ